MARDKGKSRTDIDWILRDRKVIDGIELVSVNLYQAMLPGIPDPPGPTSGRPARRESVHF
jgi:hypothetical protein